jgi:polyhydroxyalkanoate synthesis regulator phasin
MNNMMNPMQNMMNMQNPMQNMMNMMNPSSMQSQMDQATEQMKNFWNQFQSILNTNYSDFTKNFENGTLMDSYKGMFNMSEGFLKFYEMWIPMMKSINDKTFNMDMFKANMDMNKYKEFMDKYFTFMPTGTQDYMTNMSKMWSEMIKNNQSQSKDMMNNMKSSMNNMMPEMFANPFSSMLTNYNSMYGQMMNAVSPFGKLMTPSTDTKTMQEWNTIMNNMNVYNLKSAEMQYMVYQQGTKVMEKIAESVMHKIENGEEVNSMMKLYQEWLNTSDSVYVALFETDEYSQLMAEVSAMKLRIKKDVEAQMEKMFVNVPVATRSEMDEVYQTIYDLKKQVRQLQTMLELDSTLPIEETTPKKATAKKK